MTHARGAVILCGGASSRMGYPKWRLPFGPERILDRIVRITCDISTAQVLVMADPDQVVDPPHGVLLAYDCAKNRGPLEGIHSGLAAMPEGIEAVFVTSCDVPLLQPEFASRLFELLTPDVDVVVPVDDQFHHPLAAVYRTRVASDVRELLNKNKFRPVFLFDKVATRRVNVEDLRSVDTDLASLKNLNDAESYFAALRFAGIDVNSVPSSIIEQITKKAD
ncbi:MAG: molybdenum cofactor guanylyltransferase [Planctomycetales bacterium]|nr:molybdenum cofactor guanylyltransferase [Planctomycetales bacterium]